MMTTRSKCWPAVWGMVWALELISGSLAPVWAQRKRAGEPEANPQFQQQLQNKSSTSGGPISEPGADAQQAQAPGAPPAGADSAPPSAPSAGEEEQPGSPFPARGSAGAQGVQIGSAAPRRSFPEAPTNPLETRIVVRVKNAPLATFLDTISAQAKVNFIITEGLEDKRVTAFLQNVTVREALQILLEIKGLTYQRIGKSNTYVVSPRAKGVPNRITRIYTLSFIPLIAILPTPDLANQTPGGNQQNQQQQQGGAPGGGSPGGQLPQTQGSPMSPTGGLPGQTPGQMQNPDSPVAILNVIRSVLTREYGSIAIDPRTNSLIITDIPEVFPQIEQILAELDKKAPQVIIEAQIVEIDSDRGQQLGLEWGGATGELATFRGPKRDTTFPLNLSKNLGNTHFFDPVNSAVPLLTNVVSGIGGSGQSSGSGVTGGSSGSSSGLFLQSGILDLTQLTVVLRALVTRAEARFLGKPKILALNNHVSSIAISKYETADIITDITATNGSSNFQAGKPERFNTGLVLRVTPQVNREGFITMLVEPQFTDVQESVLSSRANPIFDPTRRAASTLVRVKNGQTLVLGGLLSSRETKSVRKVPFLGYIPLIGWLFTSTGSSRHNTDLVIFLTPTVVND